MNKWFESKNIANYAKTALLQAQKKIDQVLDIKEDEILASTSSAVAANLTIPTIQSVQDEQQELTLATTSASRLKKSSSNSSIASSTTSNSAKLPTQDTDSFFNTFLSKLDPSTSPPPSAIKLEQEIENINFDSFLNQTTIPPAPSPSHVVTTSSNKKQQRSSFRDILKTIEEGDFETQTIKFGSENLFLDNWIRRKQYETLRECLGPGMNVHLQENEFVRDLFDLGAPLLNTDSNRKLNTASMNHMQKTQFNREQFRNRTKSMNKKRENKDAVGGGTGEDDD